MALIKKRLGVNKMKNLRKYIGAISISVASLMATDTFAANYLTYSTDIDVNSLPMQISLKYLQQQNICGGRLVRRDCVQFVKVPPETPENWYYFNDYSDDFKKFVAKSVNGVLQVSLEPLTANETYWLNQAQEARQDIRNSWTQMAKNWESFNKYSSPTLTMQSLQSAVTEGCNAQGVDESADSALDFFSNLDTRNQIKDRVQTEVVTPNRDKVTSVNVGLSTPLGGASGGVTWENTGTASPINMPDGSTLGLYIGNNRTTGMTYVGVDLNNSKLPNGHRLSDYMQVTGTPGNESYVMSSGTISTEDPCLSEEIQEMIEALMPAAETTVTGGGSIGDIGGCQVSRGPREDLVFINYITSWEFGDGWVRVTVTAQEVRVPAGTGSCT